MSFTLGYVGFYACLCETVQVSGIPVHINLCQLMLVYVGGKGCGAQQMHVYVGKDGLKVDIWDEIHNMIQECAMVKTYGK